MTNVQNVVKSPRKLNIKTNNIVLGIVQKRTNNMTLQDLVEKLEMCRSNLEGNENNDMVNDTMWELNDIISDIEKGRLEVC